MPDTRPLSPAATAVLGAIADGVRYGFDIMDTTALPSGTVYPILGRLERNELVRAKWESATLAQAEKRPPRRYYEISAAGKRALLAARTYYRALVGGRSATRPARG